MPNKISALRKYLIKTCLILSFCLGGLAAHALPADFYAQSSALASGSWARVSVSETGMQFVSNTTLKNLGFSDPSKVNVYGFGGRMLPERLNESMADDLPLVPSIKTPTGIIFFGFSSVGWQLNTGSVQQTEYSHINNPYSDKSYYFLSDSGINVAELEEAPSPSNVSDNAITFFTERLVHEVDLIAPSNTGRLILGEDFRVQSSQNFNFSLPDNIGNALATVSFGAKTSSGIATLSFTANGNTLSGSESDKISAASSSRFITTATTVKEIKNPGDRLNLTIKFNNSGAISMAALDYIEVEYPRQLKLSGDELYFYLNPASNSMVKIEGCSSTTAVWDITDPLKPKVVKGKLSGTTLEFAMTAGYHEYIAFNTTKASRQAAAAGKISNQDIHSMKAPGMLVIAPDAYRQAADRLVRLHQETDGLDVLVLSPEQIYNEFSSGNPDVTAFRKLLKMWYDRAAENGGEYTRYCLIMSRPTYDNKMVTQSVKAAGYPRLPIWQSPTGDTESSSYSTDDYIGMLDDNIQALNIGSAKMHVAVGRMPVKNLSEANTAITKLEKYLKEPKYGSWRNNVMIIADDQDNGVHLEQAEACHSTLRSAGNGSNFLYEKLYLDSYQMVYTGVGPTYPDAKHRMMDKFAEGVLYVDYIGHANPKGWGHENLLTWTELTSMTNTNLPFIYAATCEFLRWDDDAISGAEEMWLNPTAGVIGMICPSRSVLISANGILNKSTSAFVFKRDKEGKAMRVGDIMIQGKNAGQADSNKLRYGLLGDPSMRLPSPEYTVNVESIDNVDVESSEDFPVVAARSSVKITGNITTPSGQIANDFNGIVELQLYDAEKVITTNANGEDGVESLYNDRKTQLYRGRVRAEAGKWEAQITMPLEIENNFSPALISLYAYDGEGREANGACEKFYVYGYDSDAEEDFDGPDIKEFYLNSPSFAHGDLVSPAPMAYATFSDKSGISVSTAGIGHSMTLSLDGKTHFNDVTLYYDPDDSDPTAGAIAYPLSGVEPGEHTLSFTVWDNAGNSSTSTLKFNVSASWLPSIDTLTTDVNPASTSVNFIVATDGSTGSMGCDIEVYDLSGRKVWAGSAPNIQTGGSKVSLGWDLCDGNGSRIPRGIYLYRATVTTSSGAKITKTKKLAVTAQ